MGITPPFRILIVDDHAAVREGLRHLVMAQHDMQVVGDAADGQGALRSVCALHPDIVLMDISMPGWSGVTTAQKVTEVQPLIKVIAVSRHDELSMVNAMLGAGAKGYVLKQSASDALLAAIRTVAAGRIYVDEAIRIADPTIQPVPIRRERELPADLTVDEEELLRLVANSRSNREIAELLTISAGNVATLRSEAMRKAGLASRIQVMAYARKRGWLKG